MQYLFYILFVLFCASLGYSLTLKSTVLTANAGAFLGASAGLLLVGIGFLLDKFGTKRFVWGIFGFIIGIFVTSLIPLSSLFDAPANSYWVLQSLLLIILPYLGIILALKIERDPRLLELRGKSSDSKILDTSVIIDGRIADLCETGFLEGTFLIPQFVLHELQYVADSGDSSKRVRGRRGLDILKRLQEMPNFDLRIIYDDFPSIREVDAKLVALAKQISAKVVTNDFNLNKVAGLQGVTVLNINQLTNALKPVVLPGEIMRIQIVKEGKESTQGVSYLDDGTMIVVDDGRKWLGKKAEVIVTSVLQTAAGRMIFARVRDDRERERESPYVAAKAG